MAENSTIEWTDHTFNPWMGCEKVSIGCANCYAETLMDKRYKKVEWGKNGTRKRTSVANWKKPISWNKKKWVECYHCGWRGDSKPLENSRGIYLQCPVCASNDLRDARQRVFCASLGDVFEDCPELIEWRKDLLFLIDRTPNLDWLLLTKRPENVTEMLEDATNYNLTASGLFLLMPNVWIGVSVENQEQADKRIPELLRIQANKRFLSVEPLLSAVEIHRYAMGDLVTTRKLDWIIAGGESGVNARPVHPDWVRSLRDQCVEKDVPFLFKQWGEYKPLVFPDAIEAEPELRIFADGKDHGFMRVGKKKAGRTLDGVIWNQFPEE